LIPIEIPKKYKIEAPYRDPDNLKSLASSLVMSYSLSGGHEFEYPVGKKLGKITKSERASWGQVLFRHDYCARREGKFVWQRCFCHYSI